MAQEHITRRIEEAKDLSSGRTTAFRNNIIKLLQNCGDRLAVLARASMSALNTWHSTLALSMEMVTQELTLTGSAVHALQFEHGILFGPARANQKTNAPRERAGPQPTYG